MVLGLAMPLHVAVTAAPAVVELGATVRLATPEPPPLPATFTGSVAVAV